MPVTKSTEVSDFNSDFFKSILILSVLVSAVSCAQKGSGTTTTSTEKTNVAALNPATMKENQKVSYYLGMNVASSMKNQGLNIDPEIFAQAFKDEQTGAKKLLDPAGMNTFMMEYSKKMNDKKVAEQKVAGEKEFVGDIVGFNADILTLTYLDKTRQKTVDI